MKAVTGLGSQTYEEHLVELELPSLRERQREMDMVQTYKLLNSESGEQLFMRADIRRGTGATAGRDNLLKKTVLRSQSWSPSRWSPNYFEELEPETEP